MTTLRVSVQAADLLLVLRRLPMGLTGAEQAAADRLRSAANAVAADEPDRGSGEVTTTEQASALDRFSAEGITGMQPDNIGDRDRWEDPRDTYGGES